MNVITSNCFAMNVMQERQKLKTNTVTNHKYNSVEVHIHRLAFEMADQFEENVDDGELSDDGWEIISGLFGAAEEEHRASVFVEFLRQLDERGVDYNKADF